MICYDTRGHGSSSTPTGPYTLQQLGEDVIALLDHLKIEKAAFCGISMGGLTGQWLAIHYPSRFSHVIIANTAAKIGQEQAWQDRAELVRKQGLEPIAATAASRWFTDPFIQSHPSVVSHLCNDLSAGSALGYANCCEALAKADVREQLKDIKISVLVVAGTEDQAEERLSFRMQPVELFVGAREQVFVGYAPGAFEPGIAEVLLLDHAREAIAEEEAAHVVEMALAAVDEAGVIAPLFEQIRDGDEVGLALAELDHGLGRGRGEAGQAQDIGPAAAQRREDAGVKMHDEAVPQRQLHAG